MVGAGEAEDRWAGVGSEGAGIAKLKDPDFILQVVGNHWKGGLERSQLTVIKGGFQGEADLMNLGLESWRENWEDGEDFQDMDKKW